MFHRQLYYFFLAGGSPPSIREMRREAIKTLIAPIAALCCGDRVRISFFISQSSFLEGDKWLPVSTRVHCSAVVIFFAVWFFFPLGETASCVCLVSPFFSATENYPSWLGPKGKKDCSLKFSFCHCRGERKGGNRIIYQVCRKKKVTK